MGRGSDSKSTIEYIKDPRFEVLCLASQFGGVGGDPYCPVGEEMVETAIRCWQKGYGSDLAGCTVMMQNATFDASILAYKYGVYPKHMIDLIGLARAWNARDKNDLATLSKRWGLPAKGDTSQFSGVTLRKRFAKAKSRKKGPKLPFQVPLMTPEQQQALVGYATGDVEIEWKAFEILLPLFANPAFELRVMQDTLEMFTKPSLAVDYAKGEDLIVRMNAEIYKQMATAGVADDEESTAREKISGDKSFETLLFDAIEKAGDSPIKYIKYGKNHQALLAIAQDDPQRAELEKHPDQRVRELMAARIALDAWPKHIIRTKKIMSHARAAGGLLPVPLKYCGAHTGRDSGGEGINLQNLGSRGHPLVSETRELLIAQLGQKLVITDASAIEGRITPWVAGQNDLVERFRLYDIDPKNNPEAYCVFATKVLGYRVRKPLKESHPGYIKRIEDRYKWARNQIGKIGILGCGYGMGTDTIFSYAGGAIDLETAERIKVTYRAEHPKIVQLWKDIERAFIYTAKYQKACTMPRGLSFHSTDDCDVIITLPSGREIHYQKVKLEPAQYGNDTITVYNETTHSWGHVWGGHLTENVVQAIARDVLMEAAVRLGDLGYPTALRVHDELVQPASEARASETLSAAIGEMSKTPVWAPGLPLGAEGAIQDHYSKH